MSICTIFLILGITRPIAAQRRPPVLPLRYAEDYTYLANPTKRTEVFDSVKYISIGQAPGSYLSLGGQIRQMYERFENPTGDARVWWPTRLMANADLRMRDGDFRLFGQLGSGFLLNGESPRPIDVDRLYVLNLFAEGRLLVFGEEKNGPGELRLRVGRIELNYGAGRLITIREGPNVRHYWDGGQLLYQHGNWKVDALLVSYGATLPGSFDDPFLNGQENLWGLYATHQRQVAGDSRTIDAYYLGTDNRSRTFFSRAGAETRHTLGIRWARKRGNIDVDAEAIGQVGRAGDQSIRAYGMGAQMEYTLHPAPTGKTKSSAPGVGVGIMVDYWSGDRDTTDQILNNFNPLYPRQGYYRGAGQLFPSNFFDVAAYCSLTFSRGLTGSFGYTYYWRSSVQDGIYTGGAGLPTLAPNPAISDRPLGGQLDFTVGYALDRHLSINAKYSRFWAAGFVEATPSPQEVRHFFNLILSYRI